MDFVKSTLIGLVCVCYAISAQAQIDYRLDSTVQERMTNGNWTPIGVYHYVHNGGNQFESWTYAVININGDRTNSQNTEFSYDAQTNLLERRETKYWSGVSSSWVNSQAKDFHYVNNKLASIDAFTWQGGSSSWKNNSIDSFFYNGSGDLVAKMNYSLKQGVFEPYARTEYVYKSNGNMDTMKYGVYFSAKWAMSSASVYYQDAAGRDTAADQYSVNVSNGNYSLQTKYRYARNSSGDCTRFETWRFDFVLGEWAVISADDYDVNGLVKWENILFDSDSYLPGLFENALTRTTVSKTQSGTLSPQTRSTYYYDSTMPNGLLSAHRQALKVFPNPSKKYIQLVRADYLSANSLVIYDLQGKMLCTHAIDLSLQINTAELTAGVYVLHLLDKEGRSLGNTKFIKE